MRFGSISPEYNRTVRQPVFGLVQGPGGPEKVCTRDGIMAQWEQGGLTAFEKAQMLARFTIRGLGEGENPERRLALYDTDEEANRHGWSADTKSEVEQNLLDGQNEYYMALELELAAKPWPRYDSLRSAPKIAEMVTEFGIAPEAVLAYERENRNRDEVIAALEALKPEPEPLVAA